jgi:intracellular multiplication protein IcmK
MTGAPWPIADCHFSPGLEVPKDAAIKGTHVVPLTPQDIEDHSSGVCILEGLTTPVSLRLEAGTGVVNTTFVARIPKMGPKANAPLYELKSASTAAGDDVLQNFLYGIPPQNAVKLSIQGASGDTQAWRYDGFVYVRTPLVLWSPAPADELKLDGMNVYKVQPLPLLQMSQDGISLMLHIDGARALALDDPTVKQAYKQSTDPTSLRLEEIQ